jgi:ribosomal protein S18 acetylase RimI-like enzyme
MNTTVRFAYKPFAECVGHCLTLDKKCFPEEMWLHDSEINDLLRADAKATVVTYNDIIIGLAIIITEANAETILNGVDERFVPNTQGAYSYSEAIDPEYQNRGIGSLLLRETELFTSQLGFKSMSAHVRMMNGWDKKRQQGLNMIENRIIENFWDDPRELVRFQSALI